MSEIKPDRVIDVRGLKCPMPLLRTKQALKEMEPGQILEIIADDQTTKVTFKSYREKSGDELLKLEEVEKGIIHHFIKKKYIV